MRLYHGSNVDIDVIDLSKGKRGKDFGQGFYLSDSYTQAYRMAELTVTKAGNGNPTVTVFEWDETKKSNLKIYRTKVSIFFCNPHCNININ